MSGSASAAGGPPFTPVSAVVIARDEERDLPACFERLDFVRELVLILDPRTSDRTREAALSFARPDRPVRVVEHLFEGHIAQKNFALDQAREPWILSIDADERVEPGLRDEIVALFARGPAADGYRVCRRTRYLGRWLRGGGWYPDRKIRLVRRELAQGGKARWRGEDPHDRLEVEGRVADLRGALEHYSFRDLSDHLRKIDFFTSIAARGKARRGVRFPRARMWIHPPARFVKMYLLRGGWRDGHQGLIAAGLGAFYAFLKYAKLWEIGEEERRLPAGAVPRPPRTAGAEKP